MSTSTVTAPRAISTAINPWTWQDQLGFSQAVLVRRPQETLYLAGQCSIDEHGTPVFARDMAGQLSQVVDNIGTVLAAAGMSYADVVRYDVYTTDMAEYFAAAGILVSRFAAAGIIPAGGICVQVPALAMPSLMVEVVVTAAR